jgi:nitrous oxidase accessory protein NosD
MRLIALSSLLLAACIEAEPDNPFGAGLLQSAPSILMDGEAWPARSTDAWEAPTPERVFYIAPGGDDEAFGGSDEPWGDLQTSLKKLRPGDRLILRAGSYTGPFFVDEGCQNASENRPIEIFGESGAKLLSGATASEAIGFWNPVLLINRAGWLLRNFQVDGGAFESVGIQILEGGRQTRLRDLTVLNAGSAGVTLGPRLQDTALHNVVLRNARGAGGGVGHGIVVLGGSRDLVLAANFIHHNSGDGIHVLGSHVLPFEVGSIGNLAKTNGLLIEGNDLHDNRGHQIVIGSSNETTIKANRLWNSRPSPVGQGAALELHDGAQNVAIENNLIAESTEGIVIAAGNRPEAHPDGARAPKQVLAEHNYIFNPLTPGRYGFLLDTVENVHIYHNAVLRTRKALQIENLPPKTSGLRVLNNLFLESSELGFRVSAMSVFERFDYNAFGLGASAVQSEVGESRQAISTQIEEGLIANSYAVQGAAFDDDDLARPSGVQVVDKGVAIPGFNHLGAAPDLGVFEHQAAQ